MFGNAEVESAKSPISSFDPAPRGAAPSRRQNGAALTICLCFGILTLVSMWAGHVKGPHLAWFIPMLMTVCLSAELLTGLLLLARFRVTGFLPFLPIGAAYLFTGTLILAYVFSFPGVLSSSASWHQLAIWFWTIWHLTFALTVFVYTLVDPALCMQIATQSHASRLLRRALLAASWSALACIILVILERNHLPILISGNSFAPFFTSVVAPIVALVCFAVAGRLFYTTRAKQVFELWMVVALVVSGLDATLNATAAGRYTLGWYLAKVETLATASVVLIMLLNELNALYSRISRSANIDELTGLANRRAFQFSAQIALNHARRRRSGASILMIDIDHFKKYNDQYGHAQGDECLKMISEALRRCFARATDCVARLGGEEFVALLPETTLAAAVLVAERARTHIQALTIPHEGISSSSTVSISIGVSSTDDFASAGVAELLKAADASLYQAKRAGRNRCVSVPFIGRVVCFSPKTGVADPLLSKLERSDSGSGVLRQ